jgi:uncharacterized protein (TIGR02246 family)
VSSALAQKDDRDEKAIVNLIKGMTDAQLKYDAAALDKLLTSDYIEISPLGEFDPREKVLGFYTPEANPGEKFKASVEAVELNLRRYDKIAVMIARFNYTITSDGKPIPPRSMRVTFVCRKEKGVWKIASAHFTGIRPPQSTPSSTK